MCMKIKIFGRELAYLERKEDLPVLAYLFNEENNYNCTKWKMLLHQ